MNLSPQNEWKMNTLSFAGRAAQMKWAFRSAALIVSSSAKSSSLVTVPTASNLTASPKAVSPSNKESVFTKSYAQVATSVTQTVLQKSCELKLKGLEGQKSETCSVRFQAGELAIIRTKAQLAGVSTNSYIRASSLGSAYKQPINPELQRTLLALNRELTAQGNNLNQIAKHMNNGTATPSRGLTILESIRVPLVVALMTVRHALVQGEPQP
ncbi:MAG: plasmid mobilization relaxosome protein MobC [Alphaproteobacteria bacterium]